MVLQKIGLPLMALLAIAAAEADDKKWVWGDNSRDTSSRQGNARYEVFEDDIEPLRPQNDYYQRPVQRPIGGSGFIPNRPDFISSNRPNGLYGSGSHHHQNYGPSHLYPSETTGADQGILTGPVPSWIKEGPYKEFDKCKCTEKFNCPSPGVSYGHCDVGKQYCCFATKKPLGGPLPSRPVYSPSNGVLAGPGGPVDDIPLRRPGYNNRGYGSGVSGGPIGGNRPIYSPDNGILVGPGGPFDRPHGIGGRPGGRPGGFGYGRSAKN